MYSITKQFKFDAAHLLKDPYLTERENYEIYGKCCHLHGHSYRVEVELRSEGLKDGMLLNFNEVSKVVNRYIIDHYDHQFLNESIAFILPTAENLAKWFYAAIERSLPDLYKVTVWETDTACASYWEE